MCYCFCFCFLSFTLRCPIFLRSMASMLCTQCMPLLRISLLPPICVLANLPPGTIIILIHKSTMDNATIPRVIIDSFNIICYFCNCKDRENDITNQIL